MRVICLRPVPLGLIEKICGFPFVLATNTIRPFLPGNVARELAAAITATSRTRAAIVNRLRMTSPSGPSEISQ
jgi:hypothetical protein